RRVQVRRAGSPLQDPRGQRAALVVRGVRLGLRRRRVLDGPARRAGGGRGTGARVPQLPALRLPAPGHAQRERQPALEAREVLDRSGPSHVEHGRSGAGTPGAFPLGQREPAPQASMVRSPTTSRLLSESEYDQWNELVRRSPEGALYNTSEYLDALCEAAGGTFRILAAQRGEELVGGIGLYEQAGRSGTSVSTRHLLYYNGIVLRAYDTHYPSQRTARRNEALEALAEGLAGLGYGRISLRCRSPLADVRVFQARGWTARPNYSYVVPLTD